MKAHPIRPARVPDSHGRRKNRPPNAERKLNVELRVGPVAPLHAEAYRTAIQPPSLFTGGYRLYSGLYWRLLWNLQPILRLQKDFANLHENGMVLLYGMLRNAFTLLRHEPNRRR